MKKFTYTFLFLLFSITGFSQAFTPGNLAFLQAEASNTNTTFNVIEINTTAAGQSAISTHAVDGNILRFSGSATSTGYVANSNDSTLLCFTGHNSSSTTGNVNTFLPRGVATYCVPGTFNLATTYTGASGQQTRCATGLNNSTWYIGDQNGMYSNSTTTASPTGNFRAVKAFGGVVYVSSASSTVTVIQVSTISAATGGTVTGLPGLANNANLQDFYLVSSGSNGNTFDVLYVLSATSNTAGTINKYSLVAGSWVANGSYTTAFGGFGLAAQAGGGGAYLYVTTGQGALTANSVIKATDAAGYNATISITTGNNVNLYTAPAGKIIKGIAFAPRVPLVPTVYPSSYAVSFANTLSGATSTPQTITLYGYNLTPASGTVSVTAPNTNYQVSNDGSTWGASTTVAYSSNGAVIGSLQVRFSPQSSGLKTGNITISGGGFSGPSNTIAVTGTGDNALALTFNTGTTAINPPYVTTTIGDALDPAQQQGIIVDVKETGLSIPAANYTLTAVSDNTTALPNANINITKADGQSTVKITPAAVGYANVTLTLTRGTDTKTLLINYAASSPATASAGTRWHSGDSDASAAIAQNDNYMTISDDEKNILYVFDRTQPGLAVKTFDFNQANVLGLSDGREVDVEAGVSSISTSGKSYWMGSMSNSSSSPFPDRPSRNRIFAITSSGVGAATTFNNAGSYSNMRLQLINWGDANGYNFTASAAAGHDPKQVDGFNIEGMAFGPDNTTLYIGFRAPLVPNATHTNAVIAPVQNFETWFNNGAPAGNPVIGTPIELDLGLRGIRDIVRISNGFYVILAGNPDDNVLDPAVYKWTGNPADAPVQLTSFDVTGLNIEGVMQVNESGQLALDKLQFISDNGDNVYYGDGIAAKDLTQDNFKKFRSDVVVSAFAVLPVTFEYFTANRMDDKGILSWKLGQADNVASFEIQRSANGRDFTVVGSVSALSGQLVYTFTDKNISSEKLYYRIKVKEITGNSYLSDIRWIGREGTPVTVMVYPNPVKDNQFTITANVAGNKTVEVYTASGAVYKTFNFTEVQRNINTSQWQKGFYFIRIVTAEGTATTAKLMVQ
ncbi:T9SS type A sorting domain-containing protein [Ferruginibacter sp.]